MCKYEMIQLEILKNFRSPNLFFSGAFRKSGKKNIDAHRYEYNVLYISNAIIRRGLAFNLIKRKESDHIFSYLLKIVKTVEDNLNVTLVVDSL